MFIQHVSKHQSRLTGKRPISHLEGDSDEEVSFTSKPKKPKSADKPFEFDMVDVSHAVISWSMFVD